MIKRLVGRSYFASKQYQLFRMQQSQKRGHGAPIVVFSMGKTGSTAIARAVQDATGARVFQIFRLEKERLAEAEQRYLASRKHGPVSGNVAFPGALHLWESEHLLRNPPSVAAPWTVITTVREPIAQAVSAFFHGSAPAGRARRRLDGAAHRRAPRRALGAGAAPLVRPGVRARARASTCSRTRSTPAPATR